MTRPQSVTGGKPFEISLLIGVDHYWILDGDHVVRENGPTAVHSKLGYLLSGPLHTSNCNDKKNAFHVSISPNVKETIKRFWTIESTGTLPTLPQAQNQFTYDYLKSIVQEDVALMLQNSHGKMTMLPYQIISKYVNGDLHVFLVTHLIFYECTITSLRNRREEVLLRRLIPHLH